MVVQDYDSAVLEIQRRYRVADMMVTMHSVLRDSYAKRALSLDFLIFASSIIIAALAFFDPRLFSWLPWDDDVTRIAIGAVAVITFMCSIVSWRVDWKGRADAHARAATAYAGAKFRLGGVDSNTDADEIERALFEYEEIGKSVVSIPDKKFLSLKSEHLLKIEVSRHLDRTPGVPVVLLRFKIRVVHVWKAFSRETSVP